MRRPTPMRAFTLIETLIVIAIAALLIGLLIAAVQRARDTGMRLQCSNNLKEMGLALYQYHNTNQVFPPGVSIDGGNAPYLYLGWQARLLPFMEQEGLWQITQDAFAQGQRLTLDPPHVGLATVIRQYHCPADARAYQPEVVAPGLHVALTSYLGVLGTQTYYEDGVLYKDSRVRLFDVTDGASNTLMVGERPASADMGYGWWYGGTGMYTWGTGDVILGVREQNFYGTSFFNCPTGPYHFTPGSFTNQCDLFHFWSPHYTGSHFLFVDGSVHFMGYASDGIMPALATRAGGEAVSIP